MAVRSVAVGSDPAMAAVSKEEAKVAPTGEEKWAETEEAAREVAEAEAEEAEEVATPAEAAERRGALLAEATVGAEEVRKVVHIVTSQACKDDVVGLHSPAARRFQVKTFINLDKRRRKICTIPHNLKLPSISTSFAVLCCSCRVSVGIANRRKEINQQDRPSLL